MAYTLICAECAHTQISDAPDPQTCPHCGGTMKKRPYKAFNSPPPRNRKSKRSEEEESEQQERPALNHAAAFLWWQGHRKGRTFPFECTGCGATIELRSRVVQSRRKCPGCGRAVTTAAIDEQLEAMEPERQRIIESQRGCFGCAGIAVLLIACLAATAL